MTDKPLAPGHHDGFSPMWSLGNRPGFYACQLADESHDGPCITWGGMGDWMYASETDPRSNTPVPRDVLKASTLKWPLSEYVTTLERWSQGQAPSFVFRKTEESA